MPTRDLHIVFAEKFDASAEQAMRSVGRVTVLHSCSPDVLRPALRDCDALLIRSKTHITRSLLSEANRLRVIGRAGVGLENIDLDAARKLGTAVVYTPAAATDAVADLTIGLMLGLLRNILPCDAHVRAGRFEEGRNQSRGRELGNLTVGIVGLGRIGRAVAKRCANGFGAKILYNDRVSPGPIEFEAKRVEKTELYRQAGIVSLHVPLTEQTRGLVDVAALNNFAPGSLLINTSRGAVVDSRALAHALGTGRISGAALDVFDPEPLEAGHPLLKAPNTLFTPHIGARTLAGLMRMNAVVDDVKRVLSGKPPRHEA